MSLVSCLKFGDKSNYTATLLEQLRNVGTRHLKEILEDTQKDHFQRHHEESWMSGFLVGELFLGSRPNRDGQSANGRPLRSQEELEGAYWGECRAGTGGACKAYLQRYPNGAFAELARLKLKPTKATESQPVTAALQPPIHTTSPSVNRPVPDGRQAGAPREWKDGIVQRWVPAGTFRMGCSEGDRECRDDEKPARRVRIGRGFWMQESEVTQEAYKRWMGKTPSEFKWPRLPVESVNWEEAKGYCEKVGLRLPTEEEWEYAARGGMDGARYGDLEAIGWYGDNSGKRTHEVKGKGANGYGLYDMLGNVWEWTASDYDSTHKSLRGGSWTSIRGFLRASNRISFVPGFRDGFIGFRCVGA